jgi:membrane fusion protein (multidrug efflux system)
MIRSMLRPLLLSLLLAVPAFAQDAQGLVQPFKTVVVSSPVLQEVIEALLVEEGDSVKEGQEIVQLRRAKEELSVQEAEKILENAQFVANALSKLANEKMGSRDQALKAETELGLAKIRLAMAKVLFNEKTIRSPLNGIVVKKLKESGESVDRAEKILEIIDIDRLNVQFYLDPRYLQTLQVNQPVTVRFPDLKGTAITGKISFMDPRIDASSGLFRVKVLIDNPDRKVKAGMKALADFGKKG